MNTSKHCAIAARQSQRGAALIVGLILLMVLTVLGVSGMNTATLELTMTSNAQFHQDAFQSAETGIDIAIERRAFNTIPGSPGNTIPLTPLGAGTYWRRRRRPGNGTGFSFRHRCGRHGRQERDVHAQPELLRRRARRLLSGLRQGDRSCFE
jgi:hypothetical protein